MKIKGKKKFVAYATNCARALGVFDFDLRIKKGKSGWCRRNTDGTFDIRVQRDTIEWWQLNILGHEMAHLAQHLRGDLSFSEDGRVVFWKGEAYSQPKRDSDEYYLAPWEMEARAMEDWLRRKWDMRKHELH